MARDTTDLTPVENRDQLVEWLEAGCKPRRDWRIGTEHEKFGFYTEDYAPVPYEGERGIRALLEGMHEAQGWDPILDDGRIIGLVAPDGKGAISLEPGGQFELSGAPLETIHETCRESNQHLATLKAVAAPLGIAFLGVGGSPLWSFEATPKMPKSRYQIMSRYMPKVGSQGLDMMYRTATIQVNLDFESEGDMRRKLQLGMKLQPMASALFARSPFTEVKPNGLLSWRSDIWRDTDNQRAGFHTFMLDRSFGFEAYVDWALDLPMYFVIRDGRYHDCTHVTFRQFMAGALKDEVTDGTPNLGDWNNHLTTLFPDVRLKRYLEMRGADGGPWRDICALPAFWVGLLYDDEALGAAEMLTAGWDAQMVRALRDAVPREGLQAKIGGRKLNDAAREALAMAAKGLKSRGHSNHEGIDESVFLAPLSESVATGLTPAERMLQRYQGPWAGDVRRLFDEFAY
ncbi:MAG: glutamate--cysteine ligase [Pseudomonadota bacterium]|nr:glutamate--cysteine ligase [Pseudomonadota bacterium]